jgi:Double zinc ribbon
MPPLAYFGVESSGLNLVIDLLILFVVVLYLSLIYWTYSDARRRIVDPMLIGCATAASFFPFVGTIVYMILRPPEYLEDVHERELEMEAAEARLHDLDHGLCPHCDYRIERDFIRCPSCLRKLKERCVSCSRPLDQAWTICPYCEADVPGIAPRRTRRNRPAAHLESELTQIDIGAEEGDTVAPVAAPEPTVSPRGARRSRHPRTSS